MEHRETLGELEVLKALAPIGLDPPAVERLRRLVELVLEWNAKVNLISRAGTESVWPAHVLHSLSPLFHMPLKSPGEILDLGTGGGFPGLPLAIARPEIRFTLVDATGKKVRAVEDMASRLGLVNVRVVHARAEDLHRNPEYRTRFDLVTARAVAPLADLVRWSLPLVRPQAARPAGEGGDPPLPALLAYKGGDITQEISALQVKFIISPPVVRALVFPPGAGLEEKKLVVVRLRTRRAEDA